MGLLSGELIGRKYKIEEIQEPSTYINTETYKTLGKAFNFVLSNGEVWNLADCEIEMTYGRREVYEARTKELRKIMKERIKLESKSSKNM